MKKIYFYLVLAIIINISMPGFVFAARISDNTYEQKITQQDNNLEEEKKNKANKIKDSILLNMLKSNVFGSTSTYYIPEEVFADKTKKTEITENSPYYMPLSVFKDYAPIMVKIAKDHYIQPELLASVVFVETYGGGVTGWYELKNYISLTKQFLIGSATIGITQVTPENIRDFNLIENYNNDINWQLSEGARQLASIRDALYPNTPVLSEDRLMNVLRYYNQGTRQEFIKYDIDDEDVVKKYIALDHYKKNLDIRRNRRINKKPPYYSGEISQYIEDERAVGIYLNNVLVAKYFIGGSRHKANRYAKTAYENRFRINRWLKDYGNYESKVILDASIDKQKSDFLLKF